MIHPSPASIPVTTQPSSENIVSPADYLNLAAQVAAKSESGLETLEKTQHVFIKQTILASEMFINAANRCEILNSSGQRIFLGAETTDLMTRMCFGASQPFQVSVFNAQPVPSPTAAAESNNKKRKYREVLKFDGRPAGRCGGEGNVSVTDGKKAYGSIEQTDSGPKFSVKDPNGTEILTIIGPPMRKCCAGCGRMSGAVEFDVFLPNGETQVGKIAKQWGGFAREFFTRADIWGIKFSADMNIETKSLLLAAVFLLDYQYFER